MTKTLAKICISITLLLIGLILLGFILLQSENIRKYALNYAKEKIYAKTGWQVSYQKIEGLLPLQIRAQHLTLLSPENKEYSVESLHLVFSPLDLFKGRINIHLAEMKHLNIPLSDTPPSLNAETLQKEIKLPSIPLRVRIHEFKILDMDLGPGRPRLDAAGSLDANPFKHKCYCHLFLKESEKNQFTEFSLTMQKNKDRINLSVSFFEPSDGLLAVLFPLPFSVSSGLEIELEGSRDAWQNLLNNKLGASTLNGEFAGRCCWDKSSPHKLSSTGHFVLHGDRSIQLDKLSLQIHREGYPQAPLLLAEGHLHIDRTQTLISSQFQAQAHDLSFSKYFLKNPIEGSAITSVALTGSLIQPKVELEFDCNEITVQGYTARSCRAKAEINVLAKGIEGSLWAAANVRDLPLNLVASMSWDSAQGLIKLPHLEATFSDANVHADLEYSLMDQAANGSAALEVKNASTIASLFNEQAEGSLKALVHLYFEHATQKADLEFSGENLAWHDIKIGELSGKQSLSLSDNEIISPISVKASNIQIRSLPGLNVEFTTAIETASEKWPYDLSVQGNAQAPIYVQSTGVWHSPILSNSEPTFELQINSLKGYLNQHEILLHNPCHFKSTQDGFETSLVSLGIGSGVVTAEGGCSSQQGFVQCDARNIPVNLIKAFTPRFLLDGTIDFGADLRGSPSQLTGSIQLALNDVKVDDPLLKMPNIDATFKGLLDLGRLKASGNIHGIGHHPITIDGELPLSLSLLPLAIKADAEQPIQAHVELKGEIAPILQLAIADTTSITGEASSSLDVSGTIEKPHVHGQIEIRQGAFESLLSGAVFKNIYAKMIGDGRELKITEAHAEDGNGGILTASGSILFDPNQNFPFDIFFEFNKTTLLHLDYAWAIASGKLNWKGTFSDDTLSGELNVENANIRIPEETPAQMHTVDVTYINYPSNEKEPSYHRKKNVRPTNLDIQMHIPSKGYVTGKDLDSEWRGFIAITGTDEKPLLNGSLEVMHGKYQFNGKDFELHQGQITFAGDPGTKSALYVTADQETEGMKLEAILKGPIKNPKLSFRSNPPMTQKEILSWILFNRGTDEITSSENAKLSQSMFTLSSGNSTDLLGKIRRTFGIDRIDISSKDTSEAKEVSLRVGKYISRGIFLYVNKGINSESNQVAIEAKLTKNVKAQAEINDDAEGKMILKWQKDY